MTRILLPAAMAVLLAACGRNAADDFREGFPEAETVRVDLPGSTSQALEGRIQHGLEGEKSAFYLLTRGATLLVNGGTVAVLGLVKGIAEHPPTSLTNDVAVWGPHTAALSPTTYKFTVTKVDAHEYSYVLEGKGKSEEDSAFRVILSGSHKIATENGRRQRLFGSGSFLIDWDQMQKLPEHGDAVGTAAVQYSRLSASSDVEVAVDFQQIYDALALQRVDAKYQFRATPGAGGSFEYQVTKNLDVDAARSALEKASIKSRWLETGAGRSDVIAKGGDLSEQATLSECWDESFASQYLTASFAPEAGYGNPSACAFGDANYSTVAP
jgi:hypothetical protein